MAGDWIKMRTDLHDDPAVVMIASALKVSEDEIVGKLHRLWSWANRHTVDGTAPAITVAWIDRYVGRRGFADAMILARWLIVTSEGITIPRFDRHNGESAKSRADATERKRKSRECHTESVTETGQTSHDSRPKTVTREEKRREEEPKAGRGSRLPPDWSLSAEQVEFALKTRRDWTPDLVREVGEKFRDYWVAKPGKAGTKLDWDATWRNWVRGEAQRPGVRPAALVAEGRFL